MITALHIGTGMTVRIIKIEPTLRAYHRLLDVAALDRLEMVDGSFMSLDAFGRLHNKLLNPIATMVYLWAGDGTMLPSDPGLVGEVLITGPPNYLGVDSDVTERFINVFTGTSNPDITVEDYR